MGAKPKQQMKCENMLTNVLELAEDIDNVDKKSVSHHKKYQEAT
jgi:hypothetical protein